MSSIEQKSRTQSLRALIVEDSLEDAKLLLRELKTSGYEVQGERVDSAPGLKLALAAGGWDIVLCDYTLPRFSGRKALEIVRKWDENLPFIYVSGTIGEEVAVQAMKSGAQDYVMKGNLTRLPAAVERELREAKIRRERQQLQADRQQLIQDLQAALAHVKHLSGFLSICASCKNVRDERGQWQDVARFIEVRTDVRFRHGLCPDCASRLNPDLKLEVSDYARSANTSS